MIALGISNENGLKTRLNRLSSVTRRSKSYLIQKMLETHIEDMELYYLGEKEYNEWIADGKPTISIKEARAMVK